jgi:hypothetical protein
MMPNENVIYTFLGFAFAAFCGWVGSYLLKKGEYNRQDRAETATSVAKQVEDLLRGYQNFVKTLEARTNECEARCLRQDKIISDLGQDMSKLRIENYELRQRISRVETKLPEA